MCTAVMPGKPVQDQGVRVALVKKCGAEHHEMISMFALHFIVSAVTC